MSYESHCPEIHCSLCGAFYTGQGCGDPECCGDSVELPICEHDEIDRYGRPVHRCYGDRDDCVRKSK